MNTDLNNIVNENLVYRDNTAKTAARVDCKYDVVLRIADSVVGCEINYTQICRSIAQTKLASTEDIATNFANKVKNKYDYKGPGLFSMGLSVNTNVTNVKNRLLSRIKNECESISEAEVKSNTTIEVNKCLNSKFNFIVTNDAKANCILEAAGKELLSTNTDISNEATVGLDTIGAILKAMCIGMIVYSILYVIFSWLKIQEDKIVMDTIRDMGEPIALWYKMLENGAHRIVAK